MGRRCTICTHPDADAINAALDDGTSIAEIARTFGVQRPSINRHRGTHLAARIEPMPLAVRTSQLVSTLDQVDSLAAEADRIRRAAESSGDLRLALQAVRELASLVEMAAKLRGEMPDEATVNVVQIAQWPAVLQALEQFPEARLAVSAALTHA